VIEIVATSPRGAGLPVSFESEPFVIGSDASAHLRLSGEGILGAHVRLLLTQDKGVLVINLAPSNMTHLDDMPLTTFKPHDWTTEQVLRIADYKLHLSPPLAQGAQIRRGDTPISPRPPPYEAPNIAAPAIYEPPHDAPSHMTEIYQGAFSEPPLGAALGSSMPKEWQQSGSLSAQLTLSQVQLAAGERVRVPLSLRNDYPHPLELQPLFTGIDETWITLSERVVLLKPREMRMVDILLYVPPPIYQQRADVDLLLVDINHAEIKISMHLLIIFKPAPDLLGSIQPPTARDSQTPHLRLQNHTQGTARIFVSGHSGSRRLNILPMQSEIHLPPGQSVQIPIKFQVNRRPFFSGSLQRYSVSAQEGTRAPLDFVGQVRVRPHISCLLVLVLLLAICAVSSAAIIRWGNVIERVDAFLNPSPTPTATFTPSATSTPTVRPTRTPTATPRPPLLTATTDAPPLVSDPRPAGCTQPIPAGWQPYTVRSGDTLFRLALNHGTTVDEIVRVNCMRAPSYLVTGDVILLPP
jgi:hypothetical protein